MILLIDNHDAFAYNVVQQLGELGEEVDVRRADAVTVEEIEARCCPDKIILSAGPGAPDAATLALDVVENFAGRVPVLGVGLGHQVIGRAFGGRVVRAPAPVHGRASEICHDGQTIFEDMDYRFKGARYHALVVERESLPGTLEVSATTPEGLVMGLRHRAMRLEGVQFHPGSILTTDGKRLLANFLKL